MRWTAKESRHLSILHEQGRSYDMKKSPESIQSDSGDVIGEDKLIERRFSGVPQNRLTVFIIGRFTESIQRNADIQKKV